MAQDAGLRITKLELIALVKDPGKWRSTEITVTAANEEPIAVRLEASALYGGQPSALVTYASGAVPGTWDIAVPTNQLGVPAEWADDLVLIATYQLELDLD